MSNRTKAEKLADRPYVTVTALDVPTVGNPYYFAYSPEVRHCFGTGNKPDEARNDLLLARMDLFESMLDDGLEIPEPRISLMAGDGTMVIDLVNPWSDVGATK